MIIISEGNFLIFPDPVQTAISDNVDEVTEADQQKDYSVTTNSSSEVGDSTVGEV